MAAILPRAQKYVNLLPNIIVGIHLLELVSASDTFTVPKLANTTANTSSATLRLADGNTVTVTNDGADTITLVGTAGQSVLVVSAHQNMVNFGAEV